MTKDQKLAQFFSDTTQWSEGLTILRDIAIQLGLKEDWKWSFPTYTHLGENIIGIVSFDNHFGLCFFQASLLKEHHDILLDAQNDKPKAIRQLIFTSTTDIDVNLVRLSILESITISENRENVKSTPTQSKVVLPTMLKNALLNDAQLNLNFEALSKSKRNAYSMYINDAAQEATKRKRLEKAIAFILNGEGLDDIYKPSRKDQP